MSYYTGQLSNTGRGGREKDKRMSNREMEGKTKELLLCKSKKPITSDTEAE